jgi:hypothetical protein
VCCKKTAQSLVLFSLSIERLKKMNLATTFCLFLLIPQFEFRSIGSNRDSDHRDSDHRDFNRDFDLENYRPCVVFRDDQVQCNYDQLLPHPLDCKKVKGISFIFIVIDPQWQIFTGSSPIEVYKAKIENEVGWPAFATEKGCS